MLAQIEPKKPEAKPKPHWHSNMWMTAPMSEATIDWIGPRH
jgi:hypothetical protein